MAASVSTDSGSGAVKLASFKFGLAQRWLGEMWAPRSIILENGVFHVFKTKAVRFFICLLAFCFCCLPLKLLINSGR